MFQACIIRAATASSSSPHRKLFSATRSNRINRHIPLIIFSPFIRWPLAAFGAFTAWPGPAPAPGWAAIPGIPPGATSAAGRYWRVSAHRFRPAGAAWAQIHSLLRSYNGPFWAFTGSPHRLVFAPGTGAFRPGAGNGRAFGPGRAPGAGRRAPAPGLAGRAPGVRAFQARHSVARAGLSAGRRTPPSPPPFPARRDRLAGVSRLQAPGRALPPAFPIGRLIWHCRIPASGLAAIRAFRRAG